ncbi:MAG: accessory gene regulator B family protein [Bacilli bacterium]|nr:accessory gene regulator B family protein [Bacilli bacterium]
MKKFFIDKCYTYINKHKKLNKIEKIKIKYGLEVMYHFLSKTIVILLLSYLLNIFKQTILLFIFFAPIRTFAYGLHAKSNIECWLFSIFIYVFIGLYIKYANMNIPIQYSLIIISIISLLLYAPADNQNLPLVNKQKRIKLKIKSIMVSIIYLIIFIYTKNNLIRNVICFSLVLQSILINPFIYFITKNKFNNYKYYNC